MARPRWVRRFCLAEVYDRLARGMKRIGEWMTVRRVALVILRSITGIGSLLVSAYGFYMAAGSGIRQDSVIVTLFCIFPMLSFPVFLFSFWRLRLAVVTHSVLAAAYLAVFSMLDWRACSELGY